MCSQRAVNGSYLIILEADCILLIGREALHDQIGDDGGQVIARTMQGTAIDLSHFMDGQWNGDGLAVQIIIRRDEHFA